MRISDDDRDRTIEELRRHCSSGRLGPDEFAERLQEAAEATALTELEHAMRGLPPIGFTRPGSPGPERRASGVGPDGGGGLGALGLGRSGLGHDGLGGVAGQRLAALVSSVVVIAGVVLLLFSEWVTAVVLLVGWLLGVVQGRVGGRFLRR